MMPWQHAFTAHDLIVVTDPQTRAHHIAHDRLASVLEATLKAIIIQIRPDLKRPVQVGWHIMTKEGQPLHPVYKLARFHIATAIAAIDAKTGHRAERASDFLDRVTGELAHMLRAQLVKSVA